MSETTKALAPCGKTDCYAEVDIDNPATVTVPQGLSPHTQTYYHSTCYDPWADEVGHGAAEAADPVNAPAHYRWLRNGVEVIDITESFNFLLGNVLKYVMRADHKGKPIEDLEKAAWYLAREIANRKNSGVV